MTRGRKSYVQVTLQQGGIDDLQELFATLYGGRALHERRRRRRVGVVELFHKVAAFLEDRLIRNTAKRKGITESFL